MHQNQTAYHPVEPDHDHNDTAPGGICGSRFPPEPDSCAQVYIVQGNDWLSKIAEKFFGELAAYPAIIAATNQQHEIDPAFARITHPDQLEAGWKLCIPMTQEAEILLTDNSPPPLEDVPVVLPEVYTLDDFIEEHRFNRLVDPAWIRSSPDPLPRFDISPEYQAIHDKYGYRANYLWNEYLSTSYYTDTGIFKTVPPQVKVFHASWQTAYPRYRYPPNVTLPTGLTTNQFGWRGPQISLHKPAKTIRIACVGASTTVGGHNLPFSYPEFLQHWLNLWGQENGYDVNFEVINFGREGIGSRDIATIVRYEVLPMDVDYLIYYEGSNQFDPRTMISFPDDVTFGQPPAGLVPNLTDVPSNDKSWLDNLSEYSAIAARTRSLVERLYLTGQEPPKPEQTFNLPDGLDEFRPDRAHLDRALSLTNILNDLDQIKHDLDEHEVRMYLATFNWFAYDGMILDPARHRSLYAYLNRLYWPISYANMRRLADFQNRVFETWAFDRRVKVIDVAGRMPRQPDLYGDAIHNTYLGTRIRAWINFEGIVPLLRRDIEKGLLPRPAKMIYEQHPYLEPGFEFKRLDDPASQ